MVKMSCFSKRDKYTVTKPGSSYKDNNKPTPSQDRGKVPPPPVVKETENTKPLSNHQNGHGPLLTEPPTPPDSPQIQDIENVQNPSVENPASNDKIDISPVPSEDSKRTQTSGIDTVPSKPLPGNQADSNSEDDTASSHSNTPSESAHPSNTGGKKHSVGDILLGSRENEKSKDNERRTGVQVSGPTESEVETTEEIPVFTKTPTEEENIKKAIEKNDFLMKILSGKRFQDIINAMQLKTIPAKKTLIKQGDKGSQMFISKEGKYKILIKGKEVAEFSDTRVFGELAILYNARRLATIKAVTPGKVWVLDRITYLKIVIGSNLKEQDENLRFLQNVDALKNVSKDVLRQVVNLLKPEFFPAGKEIIRQGDKGDKFYLIRAGTVSVSKVGEGILGTLVKEECFGEMALQKEDTRQATVTANAPGVECLTLARKDFIAHFGDIEFAKIEVKKISAITTEVPIEYQDLELNNLKFIRTLGVGGFGRVELVQSKKNKSLVFALKYLKKIDIVNHNQQEHVYNEKLIQMHCKSPFIVRLFRTYKDKKYVYFLMEPSLGGDLFALLHDQKSRRFEENDARFLSGCVLEALDYLHRKGIVYRDLKPENLLVSNTGYLKLTDFGFAKKMPVRGKTYTFAGTPEYVAPEVVLNRGHDRAVDYWALGVFIFELLTGKTPFRTGDNSHMRTYNKILNGIDNVNFPTYVKPKAKNLIEKLCRPIASERYGMLRGGTNEIRSHKWYKDSGFDWQKLQDLAIVSPFKPKLKDNITPSKIEVFKPDKDYPADETSGWDIHF
ncbi:hypothetical protein ABEB36_002633 [Hypothenemus hampei]|uniref:cGMP-dependent protein kinase n=1 Tax=Hypothenemus hampei TaxID=57062 RepID=A0ABD1F6G6_HYPHA